MRKFVAFCLVAAVIITPSIVMSGEYVKGYMKKDGTYVNGYFRSSPDQYKYNNYSSQGNYNPYSGSPGTQRNEYSNRPSYNDSYGNGAGKMLNNYYNNNNSLGNYGK